MSVSTPTIQDPSTFDLATVELDTTLAQQRFLAPQWEGEVQITTRFVTKTIFSGNQKPVTRLHSQRPVRTLEYNILEGGFADTSRRYNDELLRGICRFIEPIWPDVMRLDSLNSGAIIASRASGEGRFLDRRFVVGQIAVIAQWGSKTQFEYVEVTGVNADLISFTATTNEYSDPIIIPCMVADRNTRSNMQFRTGAVAQNRVARVEVMNEYSLEAFATPGNNPAGFQTHDSLPILDPRHDWGSALDVQIERPSNATSVGLDNFYDYPTLNVLRSWDVRIRTDDRRDAADLQRFIESRGGSTYPFWFLEPTEDIVFYQGGNNTLVVGPSQTFEPNRENSGFEKIDFQIRDYVYWINPLDGTIYIRKILSAIKNVGAWFLVLDGDPLPLSSDLSSRVGFASRCRFQNEYTESWTTSNHGDILIRAEEIEEASDLDVVNFSPQSGTAFEIAWEANFCSEDPECRSLYRCGECCFTPSSVAIVTMSHKTVQCLDGGPIPTGTRTYSGVGVAEYKPETLPSLSVVKNFGDFDDDIINASITIKSTGDMSTTNDGTYPSEMEATLNGCNVPEVSQIELSSGTVTGGTWELQILGSTWDIPWDATAENIRDAILETHPSWNIEVTGGPLTSNPFLLYVYDQGNLGNSDVSVDEANLLGSSPNMSEFTVRTGANYNYSAIDATIVEFGGGFRMNCNYDTRTGTGQVNHGTFTDIAVQSGSASCSGGSGAGSESACAGAASNTVSFSIVFG